MAIWRPPARSPALDIILGFTSHPEKPLRAPALSVATNLFSLEAFSEKILAHAQELMFVLKKVTSLSGAEAPATAPPNSPPPQFNDQDTTYEDLSFI